MFTQAALFLQRRRVIFFVCLFCFKVCLMNYQTSSLEASNEESTRSSAFAVESPRLQRRNNSNHGVRLQFNGGLLPRTLAPRAHAWPGGEERRVPLNHVTSPIKQLETLCNLGTLARERRRRSRQSAGRLRHFRYAYTLLSPSPASLPLSGRHD